MPTAREAFFEVARSEGVRYLFANPGTTELPLYDELAEDAGIDLVLALHEATAVAAADGYAQAARRPALVNLHIAPGVANGLGNIFNAAWARSPLVITAGQQHTGHLIQEPLLAADLVRMVEQFCKWSYEVRRPEDVGLAMRRAFKVAASPPTGPVFLSIPWDYLDAPADVPVPMRSRITHAAAGDPGGVGEAAASLLAAERPVIIAGDGVARAGAVAELVSVAEAIGARVVAEPLHGRVVFPMDHPLWVGALGPSNPLIRAGLGDADIVLAVGALLFAPFFPSPASAIAADVPLIQIDDDPYEIAKTYPVAIGVRGDPKATLAALRRAIEHLRTPDHAARIAARFAGLAEARRAALRGLAESLDAQSGEVPVPPIVACAAVVDALEGPSSVVDEAVTNSGALRAVLRQRDPDSYFFFRGGGLGWGIPAAAGVRLAQPDRRVVAVVGDGAACYVPQALWTLAHHDIAAVIVVLNNRGYYILKAQLLGMGGKAATHDRYPGMDIERPEIDFPGLAQSFGVPGERVGTASDIGPAVREAFRSGGPFLIEIPVDRAVKPIVIP